MTETQGTRVQQIRERLAKITPGKWYVHKPQKYARVRSNTDGTFVTDPYAGGVIWKIENADFIAHAPDDIAYLLSLVESERSEIQDSTLNEQVSDTSLNPADSQQPEKL